MSHAPSAFRIASLAIFLVAVGFFLGIGYQSLQHAQKQSASKPRGFGEVPFDQIKTAPRPPVVRSLRVSPRDDLLAFTAIYRDAEKNSEKAGRFLFDLKTYKWNEAKSPAGWQDSIAQWSRDGKRLLFAREKIPRPGGEGEPGLYQENVSSPAKNSRRAEPQPLSSGAEPNGEKAYAGFWTPGEKLVMKTRRESKSLYLKAGQSAQFLDRSPGTYYQNRAVSENGKTAFYVVRDVSVEEATVGLFRVQNTRARRIGSTLQDVVWAYIAENARWMIVCRYAANGRDWRWSLYRVSPQNSSLVREADIPADVIAVYWSPNFKQILGAAGKSLWLIEVPSLKIRKLGAQNDWNADDAAWMYRENKAIVASAGTLWKMDIATGKRTEMWKFPREYWE